MPTIRLSLEQEAFDRLARRAVRDYRPVTWQAEVLLRRALGLSAAPRSSKTPPDRPARHQSPEPPATAPGGDA